MSAVPSHQYNSVAQAELHTTLTTLQANGQNSSDNYRLSLVN